MMPKPVPNDECEAVVRKMFEEIRDKCPTEVLDWVRLEPPDGWLIEGWFIRIDDPMDNQNCCLLQLRADEEEGGSWSLEVPEWVLAHLEIPGPFDQTDKFHNIFLDAFELAEIRETFLKICELYAQ